MRQIGSISSASPFGDALRRYAEWARSHEERGCQGWPGRCLCRCDDHRCAEDALGVCCSSCGGRGWRSVSVTAPTVEGYRWPRPWADPCEDCTPAGEYAETMRQIYTRGIPTSLWDRSTFGALAQPSTAGDGARKWASERLTGRTDAFVLVLSGGVGSGKTHAAVAAGRGYVRQRRTVAFITPVDYLDALRATFDREGGSAMYIEAAPLAADLLIIDDLGSERPTEWTAERLFKLVNARYERQADMIVTTNLNPAKAPEGRLASRIFGRQHSRVVLTGSKDWRRA